MAGQLRLFPSENLPVPPKRLCPFGAEAADIVFQISLVSITSVAVAGDPLCSCRVSVPCQLVI